MGIVHFWVINFELGKGPKLKVFYFEAFRIKIHMPSRVQIFLYMIFGAFYITPPYITVLSKIFIIGPHDRVLENRSLDGLLERSLRIVSESNSKISPKPKQ